MHDATVKRLYAEKSIAFAKTRALMESNAALGEICAAARYRNNIFDAYNSARQKAESCLCKAGFCESLEEHSRNVAAAATNRAATDKICN